MHILFSSSVHASPALPCPLSTVLPLLWRPVAPMSLFVPSRSRCSRVIAVPTELPSSRGVSRGSPCTKHLDQRSWCMRWLWWVLVFTCVAVVFSLSVALVDCGKLCVCELLHQRQKQQQHAAMIDGNDCTTTSCTPTNKDTSHYAKRTPTDQRQRRCNWNGKAKETHI